MKKINILIILLLVLVLSSCGVEKENKHTLYFEEAFSITPYALIYSSDKFFDENCEKIKKEVNELLSSLNNKFDVTNEDSLIYKVNQNASIKDVEVDSEFAYVLSNALNVSKTVSPKYDVTIYPALEIWNFRNHYFKNGNFYSPPSSESLIDIKESIGYDNVSIKQLGVDGVTKYYVRFAKIGTKIDLGSIAKGYATDKVVDILKQNNVKNAIVNIGGNIYTFGNKEFSVGFTTPFYEKYPEDANIVGFVKVSEGEYTFVTTGIYERYIKTSNGEMYHHIIDPDTLYPVDNDLYSVSIMLNKNDDKDISIMADAYSTAIYTMGLEKGLEYVNNNDMEAIFITNNNVIYLSEGLKNKFVCNDKAISNGFTLENGIKNDGN